MNHDPPIIYLKIIYLNQSNSPMWHSLVGLRIQTRKMNIKKDERIFDLENAN